MYDFPYAAYVAWRIRSFLVQKVSWLLMHSPITSMPDIFLTSLLLVWQCQEWTFSTFLTSVCQSVAGGSVGKPLLLSLAVQEMVCLQPQWHQTDDAPTVDKNSCLSAMRLCSQIPTRTVRAWQLLWLSMWIHMGQAIFSKILWKKARF